MNNKVIEKKKILFSNCEVIVEKYDNHTIDSYSITHGESFFHVGERKEIINGDRIVSKEGRRGKKIKCKSPLGFYYFKNESDIRYNTTYDECGRRKKYIITFDGGRYEIKYLVSYNNTSICHETRPWDLSGNGMPDHFIKDLEKVLNDIVDFMHGTKLYDKEKISEFKNDVFTDLFGFPDGMKTQTNEGKILSHGFDLKMSFRKRKET